MPALGADMEDGTLVEWLIKPGDRVKRGDVVAVVETQKGAIEVEIFDEGVVSELVVPVGTKVPVGGVAGADRRSEAVAATGSSVHPLPAHAAAAHLLPRPLRRRRRPLAPGAKVTPAARRRAAELGSIRQP